MKIYLDFVNNTKVIKGFIYAPKEENYNEYEKQKGIYEVDCELEDIKIYKSRLVDNKDGTYSIDNSQEMIEEGVEYFKKEKEAKEKYDEISKYKAYLNETDYVISKLQESQLVDSEENYKALKEKYADILEKRKEARNKINELQEN